MIKSVKAKGLLELRQMLNTRKELDVIRPKKFFESLAESVLEEVEEEDEHDKEYENKEDQINQEPINLENEIQSLCEHEVSKESNSDEEYEDEEESGDEESEEVSSSEAPTDDDEIAHLHDNSVLNEQLREKIVSVATSCSPKKEEGIKEYFCDISELKIFEKMEELSSRSSFGSTTSLIDKFLNHKLKVNLEDSKVQSLGGSLKAPETDLLHYRGEKGNTKGSSSKLFLAEIPKTPNDTMHVGSAAAGRGIGKTSSSTSPKVNELTEEIPSISFDSLTDNLKGGLESYDDVLTSNDKSQKPIKNFQNMRQEQLSTADMMRMHEQERSKKELEQESSLLKQLREKLENLELTLRNDKAEFEKHKKNELSKLDSRKKQFQQKIDNVDKILEERDKVRELNINYQIQINELNEKIRNLETNWKRKTNRWEMTKKEQQERIEILEKQTAKLDAEQKLGSTIKVSDKASEHSELPHSKLEINTKKRIHFAGDNQRSRAQSTKNKAGITQNPNPVALPKTSKSTGYFSENLTKNKDSGMSKKPLRSSMKPVISSTSGGSVTSQNDNGPNPLGLTSHTSEIKLNGDGDVESVFANGTRKYVSNCKNFVRMMYTNGDTRETRPDGSVQYFYSELGITQYKYPNGLEVTSYSNGQVERKNPDGTVETLFGNGCVKFVRSDGKEEFIFPDNSVYQVDPEGKRVMFLPNGQKEIHTDSYKQRIYPDGTTRTIYTNGTFETIYPDSRIRIKDLSGKLLSDTIEKDGVRIPFDWCLKGNVNMIDSK